MMPAGCLDPARWGLTEENRNRPDPRRGVRCRCFNRSRTTPRPAAVRRRGRHGSKPVQRRGNAYAMDSVGDRGQGHRPGELPPHALRPVSWRGSTIEGQILSQTYCCYYTLVPSSSGLIGKTREVDAGPPPRGLSHAMLIRFTLKLLATSPTPARRREDPHHQRPEKKKPKVPLAPDRARRNRRRRPRVPSFLLGTSKPAVRVPKAPFPTAACSMPWIFVTKTPGVGDGGGVAFWGGPAAQKWLVRATVPALLCGSDETHRRQKSATYRPPTRSSDEEATSSARS